MHVEEESPYRLRIERREGMRVPGIVFASRALIPEPAQDKSLTQVAAVATLPGIVGASYAMPDVHWGYGFPIGGVAATDVAEGGVVSPGGVGFDISCGVRLLAADVDRARIAPVIDTLMDRLDESTPRGLGRGAVWHVRDPEKELRAVLRDGAGYLVDRGYGVQRDLDRCEDRGGVADAAPEHVSSRAIERGRDQLGSLGSGNHFLEVQAVDEIYDESAAAAFGLRMGQVCVMIHCGSRGLGHQVCTDHVRTMEKAMRRYGIQVPDRQLACVPVESPEGEAYMGAMAAAANYGRANRHLLGNAVRHAFESVVGAGVDLVYDISHNLAKLENHEVDGSRRSLCVHRKGATRALPPGHAELPDDLDPVGQPVLIPGTMGTSSYVLAGVPGGDAFFSTCHGAGRAQSRHQAARGTSGRLLRDQLQDRGIRVRGASWRGLAEETPTAYKDVSEVVAASEGAGLCRTVARLVPLGVVKG
ncbi:RtcB family protein [Actinobacteria bacterium YIM 96077]|uniref:tRNA-splicing ligase RtcB n=1 Tax=Phytoactinopolyspora halophila TaxID=1981511 RepID=A0A329QP67_9ACTN|nr:RtcB family protein [Phytoactinopolyspora halophila]AYY14578.1 RtcB family protein [Actinobacteria bacterium YIM 96077]RAW14130.1 RtcB family protein [Phytoactinopolyspora halophila]